MASSTKPDSSDNRTPGGLGMVRAMTLPPRSLATSPADSWFSTLAAEAVVMTGERNLVFVVRPDGMLVPREVTLGPRAGERYQVLAGVTEGERIVASANFLVDAESRLASGGAMAGMPGMPEVPERKP